MKSKLVFFLQKKKKNNKNKKKEEVFDIELDKKKNKELHATLR